ncbi:site-2 protease family protein [bacterium]|nr:site-2 protease family protein [bacterium]
MFGKSITLFKLLGFEVKLDFTWLILGLLITWSLATGLFPHFYEGMNRATYWVMGVVGALGLFISIVFHELCHSLVARKFGLPMKGITLFIFGGVAEMNEEPPSPKAEFMMAVAGPISSIVLGLVLLGMWFLGEEGGWPLAVTGVVNYLGLLNLILAGFNLIPAFPLDGGRVLRSILWGWKEDLRWATHLASKIGSTFGIALIILGVFNVFTGNFIGGLWWFVIGMFIRGASRMSYQQVMMRRSLEGEPVRKFMVTDPITVPSTLSIEELVEKYIYIHHFKMFPVVDDGELKGCITLNQVKKIPREERDKRKVEELVQKCSGKNTVHPDEDAMRALSLMKKTNQSRLMVVKEGQLVGIISLKDMMKFLSLKVDLGE